MKTNHFILLILLSILFNCDELAEFLEEEVTISSSYTDTISINVANEQDPNMEVEFREGGLFSFKNDPKVQDIIDNPDQVKKIEIESIKYEYKDFSGNVDVNTVGSLFYLSTGFMDGDRFSVANQNIAEADLFGTRFNLSGSFGKVNNFISKEKVMSYLYEGKVSHNPAFFRVEVTITVKFTVMLDFEELESD